MNQVWEEGSLDIWPKGLGKEFWCDDFGVTPW